jgi:hypothetical protein
MDTNDHPHKEIGLVLTIQLAPERATELQRLAQHSKKEPSELAKELLEAEIEAQHGLNYGPWLRKYMYR